MEALPADPQMASLPCRLRKLRKAVLFGVPEATPSRVIATATSSSVVRYESPLRRMLVVSVVE